MKKNVAFRSLGFGLLFGAAAVVSKANEGMWLYNDPPRAQLKEKYGFDATNEWLEHLQKSSVRFNSGGSGEFVSADGRRHSVQMSEGSSSPSQEVGDEITVLYNPEHPLDARVKSFGSSALMWVLPGITGILGLAFLGAVLVVRRFMPSSEPQNELA